MTNDKEFEAKLEDNFKKKEGSFKDLILSRRIRLARNIKGRRFPHMLTKEEANCVINEVSNNFFINDSLKENFKLNRIMDISSEEKLMAMEKRYISKDLMNGDKGAYIVSYKDKVSIMINEEDHLRIQAFSLDKDLWETYKGIIPYDDLLEEGLQYAFNEELGYITTCPTNLGTGLRASVMVHLPVFTRGDKIGGIIKKLAQMGMTIRGIYGEGSQAKGNIYQISNEVTLGLSEEYIIENIEDTVAHILTREFEEEVAYLEREKYKALDGIYRSLGILRTARMMTRNESLGLLSNIRLGAIHGILDIDKEKIDELILNTGRGTIAVNFGLCVEDMENIDILRASLLRKEFN